MIRNQGRRLLYLLFLSSALLFTFGHGKHFFAQTPVTNQALLPIVPSEHPITREELQTLLTKMKNIEAQKTLMHESLEAKRKTMPAWFPPEVWNELETKIEGIDIVEVALPVYQKYVSQEQADAIILLLQGPTGEQIGQRTLDRALSALHSGARGSAADEQAMAAGNAAGDSALWFKRVSELTPEQREWAYPLFQSLVKVWKQIDDEQDVLYGKKTNEVYKAVLNAHMAEIQAAQRRATQTAPNHAPAVH
jgi:hypothetical protein